MTAGIEGHGEIEAQAVWLLCSQRVSTVSVSHLLYHLPGVISAVLTALQCGLLSDASNFST
jgi:hypothetical protein